MGVALCQGLINGFTHLDLTVSAMKPQTPTWRAVVIPPRASVAMQTGRAVRRILPVLALLSQTAAVHALASAITPTPPSPNTATSPVLKTWHRRFTPAAQS